MKKTKLFLASALLLGAFAISATPATETTKPVTEKLTALNSCGVGAGDVVIYLQNCSHHHTVYTCTQILGTCSFTANVENGIVSTVSTSGGSIIGHVD